MDNDELRDRAFNRILDDYLMTGTMSAAGYDELTDTQKVIIQCIKRAFARINSNQ